MTGRILVAWAVLYGGLLVLWHVLTVTKILPPFFFGQPLLVLDQIIKWFATGIIWKHLSVTLVETALAFFIGLITGVAAGLWLGLHQTAALLFQPIIKAVNSMPRVVLAPIFALWFGLGIWSKVAFGVTLVFFIVFFNVYRGIREISPLILANARMLGAGRQQLLVHVYVPSALTWVFSSLHTSVGLAFVGAVVGEYLGSKAGIGNLILQAEGVFDINGVLAGVVILTICALILDGLVTMVENRMLAWQPQAAA